MRSSCGLLMQSPAAGPMNRSAERVSALAAKASHCVRRDVSIMTSTMSAMDAIAGPLGGGGEARAPGERLEVLDHDIVIAQRTEPAAKALGRLAQRCDALRGDNRCEQIERGTQAAGADADIVDGLGVPVLQR